MPPPPSTAAEREARDLEARRAGLAAERSRFAAGFLARAEVATAASALAVVAAAAFLLVRLVPDVSGKPLFDDEVLAGLTALHPVGELLDIVLSDRGGAPLHFVLAHVALALDASPEALRWLSVVFAAGAVPVCYDLGRRLGGRTAGVTAAVVASTSSMLAVYGTIGRMYALFAFVSALALDLFVRALEKRTVSAVFAAALAAWFLPAAHPYGIVIVAVEAAIALVLWRGRPVRPALPVLGLAVALAPFVVADLRLSERFGVSAFERTNIAPPDFAAAQLGEALAAFAGGIGATSLVFFGLALCGLFVTARRNTAFAVFALVVLASVPVLMVVGRAEEELVHQLSPRHLTFGLPVWAALVGVGVARILRDLPRAAVAVGVAAVATAAAFAPAGIPDPRTDANATEGALAAPSAWVRSQVDEGSVLLFYSPVFLAALPDTRETMPVPRSGRPLRMVARADYPVPSVVLSLPLTGTVVGERNLRARIGAGATVGVFPDWLVVERPGPFADEGAVLRAGRDALLAVWRSTRERSLPFRRDLRSGLVTVCGALAELGEPCPATVLRPGARRLR